MIIEFTDVGREKWHGVIVVPQTEDPDAIAELAQRTAARHLATRHPDTEYDAETNEGTIFAGFRAVGSFKVQK